MGIPKGNLKEEMKKRFYSVTLKLIAYINSLPKNQSNEVVGKQLIRSGTSIMANYIEAQAASSKKDFANFLRHSLKSANESQFWLELLRDTNKNENKEVQWLLTETHEISNILAKSLITLKNNSVKS